MQVFVSQVYIEPGVSFPFSHFMQRWLGEELSRASESCDDFERRYGNDFSLMIRVSAKADTPDTILKGPTVFAKDKDVEYSIFLPYDMITGSSRPCRAAVTYLMAGIQTVFERIGVDPTILAQNSGRVVDVICSDSRMLEAAWPDRPAH